MEALAQKSPEKHSSSFYAAPKCIPLACEGYVFESMLDNVLYQSYSHIIWKQLKWTLTYQQHQN